jgi:hypothetical protein
MEFAYEVLQKLVGENHEHMPRRTVGAHAQVDAGNYQLVGFNSKKRTEQIIASR